MLRGSRFYEGSFLSTLLVVVAIVLFGAEHALAHATILPNASLAPRTQNPGLKRGPCGGVVRTANPAIHKSGTTIQIDWKETINHPSRFEFYFSPSNDENFVLLKTVIDEQDGTADLPHFYSTTMQLPSVTCAECTIQMVQVMLENPQRPRNYYSCADLQVVP